MGLDACWADDFHHVVRVMLTHAREGYYRWYEGTAEEFAAILQDGWLFHGEARTRRLTNDPNESAQLSPAQFVFCIMNHDQIGNQAFGQRLNAKVEAAAYRAASALLCLAPYTPLIFMGQEWAATAPFQFFTDHEPDLGRKITAGRREEFKGFAAFRDPATREKIPDPQAESTFLRSKLRWEEVDGEQQAATLRLYRELLQLRRTMPTLQNRERENWQVTLLDSGLVQMEYRPHEPCRALPDLNRSRRRARSRRLESSGWTLLLSTNEERFRGEDSEPFALPEVRVLTSTNGD